MFSSLIVRKDIKKIDKEVLDTNPRLRNLCNQNNIDYISNTNIKEHHQGKKELHLNKRGNSVLAQNLLRYLRSKYLENGKFNCFTESYYGYKSKNLSEDSTDSYEENLKDISKKILQNIVIGQVNINPLRSKFDLLAEQIKRIIDLY